MVLQPGLAKGRLAELFRFGIRIMTLVGVLDRDRADEEKFPDTEPFARVMSVRVPSVLISKKSLRSARPVAAARCTTVSHVARALA